jgi:hypothetical protein
MNNEPQKEAWDFDGEDRTFELVTEIRHYEGYYTDAIGDEFSEGLDYVVKNMEEIQGLDRASQVELVRMGYDQLAEDMGLFAHVLRSIAERGTTVFYGSDDNLRP